jgi:hypothetical protein
LLLKKSPFQTLIPASFRLATVRSLTSQLNSNNSLLTYTGHLNSSLDIPTRFRINIHYSTSFCTQIIPPSYVSGESTISADPNCGYSRLPLGTSVEEKLATTTYFHKLSHMQTSREDDGHLCRSGNQGLLHNHSIC